MQMLRFNVYFAHDGWRWRLTAANGRIVADSGEAYVSQYNAARAARRTSEIAHQAAGVFDEAGKAVAHERQGFLGIMEPDPF